MALAAAVERSIRSGDAQLHARVEGRPGAPFITCLHALATDTRLWGPQLAALCGSFQILTIDMRGHGRSTPGSDAGLAAAFTLNGLAADVVAVWDALGISRSAVLGLSIGGMLGLELALAHPERVTALVAADCRADAPQPFKAMWPARRAVFAEAGLEALADATIATWFGHLRADEPNLAAPHPAEALARAMITNTSPAGYAGASRALEGLDLLPRLSGMTRPVLYIVGSEDGMHPAAMRVMSAATPGSALIELPGAGHLASLEQPDAFSAVVLPFLRGVLQQAAA